MALSSYCYGHQSKMVQKFSKTKTDESGNPKPYFSHIDPDGNMCFGIGKTPVAEHTQTVEAINQNEVEKGINEFETEVITDDTSPMTKRDWKKKDEQIARLTLAKSFIQANVDFDTAVESNDLEKWIAWVIKGEI